MIFYKRLPFIIITTFFMTIILLSNQTVQYSVYSHEQDVENIVELDQNVYDNDPVLKLLGKSFIEIEKLLGEPNEKGYSGWNGPHYFIHYKDKKGIIRFCSPDFKKNKIAVSIILGPGQDILGVKVGMSLLEIRNILGVPNFGPELGMDNLYYMDYFYGEVKNEEYIALLSFTADAINSPTKEAFIKRENGLRYRVRPE